MLRPKSFDAPKLPRENVGRGAARVYALRKKSREKVLEATKKRLPPHHPVMIVLQAMDASLSGYERGQVAIEDAIVAREAARPESNGPHRASFASIRALILSVLVTAGSAKIAHDYQGVEQPTANPTVGYSPASFGSIGHDLPEPDEDIQIIMAKLTSPQAVDKFLGKNVHFEYVNFPIGFVKTFRRSPEEFLKNGKGPCNNYGEFVGEWAASQGMQSYVLVLRPPGHRALLDPWHQVNVMCAKRGSLYFIFDNGALTVWKGSLDAYCAEHQSSFVQSYVVPWRRNFPTFTGKTKMHAHPHVNEEGMAEYPQLELFAADHPNTDGHTSFFLLPLAEKAEKSPQLFAVSPMAP